MVVIRACRTVVDDQQPNDIYEACLQSIPDLDLAICRFQDRNDLVDDLGALVGVKYLHVIWFKISHKIL